MTFLTTALFRLAPALALVLALWSSFLAQASTAQSVQTFGTLKTTVNCPQRRCVADGKGQEQVQQMCDQGVFDDLCEAGDCSCPTSTGRVRIMCEEDACVDAKSLSIGTVEVSRDQDVILKYELEGAVLDKALLAPSRCVALMDGWFNLSRPSIPVPPALDRAIVQAVRKAVASVRGEVAVVCELTMKLIVEKAASDVVRRRQS